MNIYPLLLLLQPATAITTATTIAMVMLHRGVGIAIAVFIALPLPCSANLIPQPFWPYFTQIFIASHRIMYTMLKYSISMCAVYVERHWSIRKDKKREPNGKIMFFDYEANNEQNRNATNVSYHVLYLRILLLLAGGVDAFWRNTEATCNSFSSFIPIQFVVWLTCD